MGLKTVVKNVLSSDEAEIDDNSVKEIATELNSFDEFWKFATERFDLAIPIVSYKFYYILHYILFNHYEDVRSQITPDRKQKIKELEDKWPEIFYGRLITDYQRFLLKKIEFHEKFPEVPGNFEIDFAELDSKLTKTSLPLDIVKNMMGAMEDSLELLSRIVRYVKSLKLNSMAGKVKCMTIPFNLCIEESFKIRNLCFAMCFESKYAGKWIADKDRLIELNSQLTEIYEEGKKCCLKSSDAIAERMDTENK